MSGTQGDRVDQTEIIVNAWYQETPSLLLCSTQARLQASSLIHTWGGFTFHTIDAESLGWARDRRYRYLSSVPEITL